MDSTEKKLADAQQQIALLKRVLLDLGESAAREICVPFEDCIAGPIGRARELLAGFVPELGKPMGMIPVSVGRPAFDKGERVIVYTEGVDFAGQQYFHIKAEDLWEADPQEMSQVAAAATHWMYAPCPGDGRDDFTRGYFCAVAVALREDGDTTIVRSLFQQGGDANMADDYDKELFVERGLLPAQR